MLRRWLVGASVLALAGCDPVGHVATATATGVVALTSTLPSTKKLPSDHVMSAVTGRDCSIIHFEKDGDYCPPYPQEVDRSKLRCVKTLGGVECHELPDPYLGDVHTLASPAPPKP